MSSTGKCGGTSPASISALRRVTMRSRNSGVDATFVQWLSVHVVVMVAAYLELPGQTRPLFAPSKMSCAGSIPPGVRDTDHRRDLTLVLCMILPNKKINKINK
jgi:hypothetical protein